MSAAFLVLLAAVALRAADPEDAPDTRPLAGWQSFEPAAYGDEWMVLDRNDDGVIDYAVRLDDRNEKVREAMDFNYDGSMDDFYFYRNGVLERQEVDTNYDGRIDVWIHLRRGVYIEKWERDRDYDGVIDDRGVYGDEQR